MTTTRILAAAALLTALATACAEAPKPSSGTDGDSDGLPVCGYPGVSVDGSIRDVAGPLKASVKASVTVTASSRQSGDVDTVVLNGPAGEQWTVTLHIPEIPADLVRVGDVFDLDVVAGKSLGPDPFAGNNQTIVLAHGPQFVLFTALLSGSYQPSGYRPATLPSLSSYGIALADGGATCADPVPIVGYPTCPRRGHSVTATVGTTSAVVARGATSRVGPLSLSLSVFDDHVDAGACDSPAPTRIAGFMLPL